MATKTLEFTMGMTCGGCANAAKNVLQKIGIDRSNVVTDVTTKTVVVTTALSREKVEEALKKTGKEINFVGEK